MLGCKFASSQPQTLPIRQANQESSGSEAVVQNHWQVQVNLLLFGNKKKARSI